MATIALAALALAGCGESDGDGGGSPFRSEATGTSDPLPARSAAL